MTSSSRQVGKAAMVAGAVVDGAVSSNGLLCPILCARPLVVI